MFIARFSYHLFEVSYFRVGTVETAFSLCLIKLVYTTVSEKHNAAIPKVVEVVSKRTLN